MPDVGIDRPALHEAACEGLSGYHAAAIAAACLGTPDAPMVEPPADLDAVVSELTCGLAHEVRLRPARCPDDGRPSASPGRLSLSDVVRALRQQ